MTRARPAFWVLVLAVIGADLWWSSTPPSFDVWWIPLIALNAALLVAILYPILRGPS